MQLSHQGKMLIEVSLLRRRVMVRRFFIVVFFVLFGVYSNFAIRESQTPKLNTCVYRKKICYLEQNSRYFEVGKSLTIHKTD